MDARRKEQTMHSQRRRIVRKIINKCDEEADRGHLFHLLRRATVRAADYTGISDKSICKIRRESHQFGGKKLPSPGRKRPKSLDKKMHVHNDDKKLIRTIIHEFYVDKQTLPVGTKLLKAIQEKMHFPWSRTNLYRLLQSMGYEYKRTHNIRKMLMERPNIVHSRTKYLQAIEDYRTQGKNIVYIGEMWIDSTLCVGKCWHGNEIGGDSRIKNSSNYLIIIHAGGKSGFINKAELILQLKATSGFYNGQMNAAIFENWLMERLLPNIPPDSLIVMDNAPYHSVELNKPPSMYSTKQSMIDWLIVNQVPFAETMRKCLLYELIQKYKDPKKMFKADTIIQMQGHSVLRLPPHVYDLNPIELASAQLQREIHKKDPISELTNCDLLTLTYEAINKITDNDWKEFCKQVENNEKEYWVQDQLLEDVLEDFLPQLDSSESDEDSDDSSVSIDD